MLILDLQYRFGVSVAFRKLLLFSSEALFSLTEWSTRPSFYPGPHYMLFYSAMPPLMSSRFE